MHIKVPFLGTGRRSYSTGQHLTAIVALLAAGRYAAGLQIQKVLV